MYFHYLAKLFYAGDQARAPLDAAWLERLHTQIGTKKQTVYMPDGEGVIIFLFV